MPNHRLRAFLPLVLCCWLAGSVCAQEKPADWPQFRGLNGSGIGGDQFYASPVLADGKLYYVARSGRTHVLAAGPKYERLAVNQLGDRSTFNASPAITGNRLLLRSDQFLYCIGAVAE